MKKLLQSKWLVVLLGSACYLGTTAALVLKAKNQFGALPAPIQVQARQPGPSWDFHNPEMDLLVQELKKEKDSLAAKEAELKELSTRLQVERAEINLVIQLVHGLQKEVEQTSVNMKKELEQATLKVKEEEVPNLKRLAKMYANMSPEGAATILKQMEEEQIVKFMVYMKDPEAAPILESFSKLGEAEAKRAALISDRIRTAQYRTPAANK
jgi:flagellar motility protein MotE (MotC chaperone)